LSDLYVGNMAAIEGLKRVSVTAGGRGVPSFVPKESFSTYQRSSPVPQPRMQPSAVALRRALLQVRLILPIVVKEGWILTACIAGKASSLGPWGAASVGRRHVLYCRGREGMQT
jgi:hypothetical protein